MSSLFVQICLQAFIQIMDLFIKFVLHKFGQRNRPELSLIRQHLLFERRLEPERGDYFDAVKTEGLKDRLVATFAPHKMCYVFIKSTANLASMIQH